MTIESAKRAGRGPEAIWSISTTSHLRSGGDDEDRAAERQSQPDPQKCKLEACRRAAKHVDWTRKQPDVARGGGISGKELARDDHQRKQQRVPIGDEDRAESGRVQQSAQARGGVAPRIGDRNIVPRQHPAIGWQVEYEPAVFCETATELAQRVALIDAIVTQDVGAKDRSKGGIGEGQLVDRSGADRAGALGGGARAGQRIAVKAEQSCCGVPTSQLQQKATGAASRVQYGPAERVEAQAAGEHQHVLM